MRPITSCYTILTILALACSCFAAGGVVTGPNQIAPERYVYYPGTEVLAEDEVRVVATGTGMPDQRRGQASASFIFEFGNEFTFDLRFHHQQVTGGVGPVVVFDFHQNSIGQSSAEIVQSLA